MEEFNENPFKKDTPVKPFSNCVDAENWKENNCYRCINYESESTCENEAKCKMAYYLDLGYIEGTIPLWVAKEIGVAYNPLYQTGKLDTRCRGFRTGNEPF